MAVETKNSSPAKLNDPPISFTPSSNEEQLRKLPTQQHDINWRVQPVPPRPYDTFNSAYKREAILIQQKGVQYYGDNRCTSCQKGRGPFKDCTSVNSICQGAYSNCYFHAQGASRCSLNPNYIRSSRTTSTPSTCRGVDQTEEGSKKPTPALVEHNNNSTEGVLRKGKDLYQSGTQDIGLQLTTSSKSLKITL